MIVVIFDVLSTDMVIRMHPDVTRMDESNLKSLFGQALHAAERRARELGEEFGKD